MPFGRPRGPSAHGLDPWGHVERCEDLRPQPDRLQLVSQPPPAFAGAGYCPKFQGAAAKDWLAAREADLLPVGYFHLVFTLPAEIAPIAYQTRQWSTTCCSALRPRRCSPSLPSSSGASCCMFCRRGSIASVTTIARQRHLQGQYRARQGADRYAPAVDRSVNGTGRPGRDRRRRGRLPPAMPLLRRPHDHRRELRTWRCTSRPALAASRGQDRYAMTPITASSQLLPTGNLAAGIAPLSPRRLRSHLLHPRSG